MNQPIHAFQNQTKQRKTGQVQHLTVQVSYWQKLTKIIQPLLPQPERWQVACYQHGILTVTGENQAMISQLGYLQQHYVAQLLHIEDFKDLQKINVRLREKTKLTPCKKNPQSLPAETQEMLQSAAQFIKDPKLSQALLHLASNKK